MTLNITEGTVPEVTQNRSKEENPFDGRFPTAEGKSMVVELPSETEEEQKYVNKVVTQAQAAARNTISEEYPQGYTARVKREPVTIGRGAKAKPGTRLTIWSVDRIQRKRKEETESAPESAESE